MIETETGPGPPSWSLPAQITETHVSVLFLVGDRAYKLKKGVSFDFLDLSTREAREANCRREVELNRRLAPDVYLGIMDLSFEDGTPCDHLVVMKRMPEDRRLASLARRGENLDDCIRAVAHTLSTFHARASRSKVISRSATPEALQARWHANFSELRDFVGRVLDEATFFSIHELADSYVSGRSRLFEKRIAEGRIVDGHGDLQAEDIFCLEDGPRILDCVEFDESLRHGDMLADAAFLAMDLERLGASQAADRFMALYRDYSADTYPSSLLHYYVAYRALVRSKVACVRHQQGLDIASAAARQLATMCLRHLEAGEVTLVLVGGLPGTGKSTLATGLGSSRGWAVERSDQLRREISGLAPGVRSGAGYETGIYSPETTDAAYTQMLHRARVALESGEPVILDATWTDRRWRQAAKELASATSSRFVEIRCVLASRIATERMKERSKTGRDLSEAGPDVARRIAARADPWPSAVAIDTSGSPASSLGKALRVLSRRRRGRLSA